MDVTESTPPVLDDPWADVPIPLDGVLERNAFPPWLMAVLAPVVLWLVFQLLALPLILLPLLLMEGVQPQALPEALLSVQDHSASMLTANSIGQFLGLALPALILAGMHSSRRLAFLRLRRGDVLLVGLALVGLVAFYPVVQWLGAINETVPLPEWLENFERSQLEMIERMLMRSDLPVWFSLLALAVTPAFCEELLFRGYVQRQAERSMGVVWGILFAGLTFGFFHLRISQFLPLSALGIYLAYCTWRTGSLWPAIVVHFANNGFAVAAGAYARANPSLDLDEIETMQVPWYILFPCLVVFTFIVYQMRQWALMRRQEKA